MKKRVINETLLRQAAFEASKRFDDVMEIVDEISHEELCCCHQQQFRAQIKDIVNKCNKYVFDTFPLTPDFLPQRRGEFHGMIEAFLHAGMVRTRKEGWEHLGNCYSRLRFEYLGLESDDDDWESSGYEDEGDSDDEENHNVKTCWQCSIEQVD